MNTYKNTALLFKRSAYIRLLSMVIFVFNLFFASTVFGQIVGDYRSSGNVTFNAATNWQIYNGTAWVTTTIAPTDALYTNVNTINVLSGNTATVSISVTIAAKLLVEGTFILNSNANLNIGSIVVDYNGAGNAVTIIAGSALIVNGNFTVTKGDMNVAGAVYIDGNFSTTTGNVGVVGVGSMASSGSMTTQGNSEIFGRKDECLTGPCNGTSLNCQGLISPASQVICQSSQSAPITFSRTGATVIRWQSTTDFLTFTDIANSTTTLPAQTLTQTTRFRAVYTSSGCAGNINSPYATVTVGTTNTWTGTTNTSWFTTSNWSCGSLPTASSDVTIPNVTRKPIIDGANTLALANTLTVNITSSLTVNSGNTLKVTNTITNNGTLTFEDWASLVQINSSTNSGNIIYKRQTATRNTDYTYWSTPVSPLKLASTGGISYAPSNLAGSIFYSFLVTPTTEDWKAETAGTTMEIGKGYSIRGSGAISSNPPSLLEATFTGVPNNGTYSITVAKANASYLLGNPYPSAIDADQFLIANASILSGTLYFWTHNTLIGTSNSNLGSGALAYTSDDYATYNITGGVGIDPSTTTSAAGTGGPTPNGKIAAGQGFFGTSKTTGTVAFTNAMRLSGTTNVAMTGANQQFFKTRNSNTLNAKTIEKHRVWLNLSNTQGAFKQTLLGYISDATNEYDSLFDGESFDGNAFVDFYSINQDLNLVIQGRALPFDENDEVPLGYRSTINSEFTISIDQVDGLLNNQNVFIEDKLTNKVFNLKEGNYTFNTVAGIFDDRFVLRFTDKTLEIKDFNAKENKVQVSIKNQKIQINSFTESINQVTIYDLLGRQIYQKLKVNSKELWLSDFVSKNQTLIVKTSLQNGSTVTEKVIY